MPRKMLLLWKKWNMNIGRKTSISTKGWKRGARGREAGQNPLVSLLDPKALYYCVSLGQRPGEKMAVWTHGIYNFLPSSPSPQAEQPPGCPNFQG